MRNSFPTARPDRSITRPITWPRINGVPAQWREASEGLQIYALSSQAVSGDGDDKIEIVGPEGNGIRVNRVEVRLAPPGAGVTGR